MVRGTGRSGHRLDERRFFRSGGFAQGCLLLLGAHAPFAPSFARNGLYVHGRLPRWLPRRADCRSSGPNIRGCRPRLPRLPYRPPPRSPPRATPRRPALTLTGLRPRRLGRPARGKFWPRPVGWGGGADSGWWTIRFSLPRALNGMAPPPNGTRLHSPLGPRGPPGGTGARPKGPATSDWMISPDRRGIVAL